MLQILDDATFPEHVYQQSGKVLVEFFATWCPHCKRMQPNLDQAAAKIASICPTYQVDVDKSPALAQQYAPDGFPTLVLFENGSVAKTLIGEQDVGAIVNLVES